MNTAIGSHHFVPQNRLVHWFVALLSGFQWGLEMHRRYDRERAAGRPVDEASIRRMICEVDAWLGRRS